MMKRISLLAAMAFCLSAAPALATDPLAQNEVINGQLNLGTVWASLNVVAQDVDGDVNLTAAAIANSFSAELGDHSVVKNYQRTHGAIAADLNASLGDIDGDVNLTAAAVGNTASVHSHGNIPCPYRPEDCPQLRAELILRNTQLVNTIDPSATLNVTANGVGNINGTAAAIGNSLSVEAGGFTNSIQSWQANGASTNSTVNANISSASGVNMTSAAVANTVSIDNLIN